MERISQKIGRSIFAYLQNNGVSEEEAANKVGYSFRDFRRLIEGRLIVSPRELEKISGKLGISLENILSFDVDNRKMLPNLEYNKKFSKIENLYFIVDLLDDYIELKEQM